VDSPASTGLKDLAPALDALPLFPLPQTVLFPGALLPLHIFEPRYRAMVKDALETHRVLAVVLITGGTDTDSPVIADVAGAGVIIDHAELPGGRYNILVRGRARVRLTELPFVPPYRRARGEILMPSHAAITRGLLGDTPHTGGHGEVSPGDLAALLSTAASFAAVVRERDKTFDFRTPKDAGPAAIADLCAHHLVLDAKERQAILETLDIGQRVRRVAEVLAVQRATLAPARGELN
jgi:Lon protease-like protein